MKKFTFMMALFVCAIGFSQKQATSFTSSNAVGENVNIGPAGTATRLANTENRSVNAVSITHSNTQTIEAGAEIACALAGVAYRDNSIYRDFDLANDFGIAGDFIVTDAEIAIGAGVITPTGFPLTVNIYSTTTGSFPGGTLTLQGTAVTTIFDTDSETIISIPVAATIPAGESMIYEVMIVDDGTDTNFMRFGANNDGQTGISYIKADACGAPDPIDMAVAFGLTNSFVMNIIGDEDLGGAACMFAEDFDAGMPAGWTTIVNTGICDWMNGVDLPTGGPLATNAMIFDDDACGSGADASNVTLMSDVYDTSVADTYMTLGYDAGFQNSGSSQSFSVEVYDGAAWQQVMFYDADFPDDLVTESVDVFAYANAAFQVRWTYDDGAGSWGWYAAVDNFCLDFDLAPAPTCVEFEDFDAGLPAGWSTVIDSGICDWMNGVDLPTGGPLATPAMIFDDDACGSGADPSIVTLVSDVYYTGNATYITLTYDVGFQESGDQTLSVEVYDGAAWQQVALYDVDLVDDLETATIDVSVYANADFQVRWVYDDNGGAWGWYAAVDNFCLDHDAILGTADNTIEGFNFYPNPSTNVVNVSAQDNIENVAIFNILGQKVVDQNINATTSQINVSNLATGTYIMKATVNGVTASYKLIKN